MSKLVLIDGNAILHRAFHALPPMTSPKGQQTNAVYGFISMLLSVMTQLRPTHVAVAFDRPKPTFRKELFKAYQAHRPKMDEGLVSQIGVVHAVLVAMGIPIFELDGFEADDVLGTIAKKVQSEKETIEDMVIVTGDRDLLQLVNHHVKLFMPIKGLAEAKLFGEIEAQERMGVVPKLIPDLKGLMGDASDNYPGVAGIGPKTAVRLLKEFGSIENIYKNLDKITNPAVVEKLQAGRENALLSHKLATVVTDVPITFNPQDTQLPNLVNQKVLDLFGDLGFKTLLKRLLKVAGGEIETKEKSTQVVSKEQTDDQLGLF